MNRDSSTQLAKTYVTASFLFGLILAYLISGTPWIDDLNHYGYDTLLSISDSANNNNKVVVIGIGDQSLKHFKDPLVFWHHYLSRVITGMSDVSAAGVALDIVPSISMEHLAPKLDKELVHALIRARNKGTKVFLGFKSGRNGVAPHRKFILSAAGLCSLNLYPDSDGIIRRQRMEVTGVHAGKVSSIAYCMASLVNKGIKFKSRSPYIDYRIGSPAIVEFADVYDWARNKQFDKLRETFSGKLVYIGITSFQLPDNYPVPIQMHGQEGSRMAGVSIHALTTEMLIKGNFLHDVNINYQRLLWILCALFSGFCFLLLPPSKAILLLISITAIVFIGIFYAFSNFLVFPLGSLGTAIIIPGMVIGSFRYSWEYFRFRRLQRYFSSYVHPDVLKEIIDHPEYAAFEGKKTVVTVMFTDICNFTSFSEYMEAECLVKGLNRYFSEMTESVLQSGGYLNRFLGDGILAIFGAPNKLPFNGALAAVKCAVDMLERLEELNRKQIFPGNELTVNIGVGIHTGEAVVGNIGCHKKMDYSIIGDTVNLASRIEGETRRHRTNILISRETYNLVKDQVEARHVTTTKVKGRKQEVDLYEILQLLEN